VRKREGAAGASSRAGLLGRWLRAGPVGLVSLFFVLILFSIFAANCFVLFEKANLFEKIKFKFCQLLNKVLMCLVTHKTLFGKV
jgi:hypothetical protein